MARRDQEKTKDPKEPRKDEREAPKPMNAPMPHLDDIGRGGSSEKM